MNAQDEQWIAFVTLVIAVTVFLLAVGTCQPAPRQIRHAPGNTIINYSNHLRK